MGSESKVHLIKDYELLRVGIHEPLLRSAPPAAAAGLPSLGSVNDLGSTNFGGGRAQGSGFVDDEIRDETASNCDERSFGSRGSDCGHWLATFGSTVE